MSAPVPILTADTATTTPLSAGLIRLRPESPTSVLGVKRTAVALAVLLGGCITVVVESPTTSSTSTTLGTTITTTTVPTTTTLSSSTTTRAPTTTTVPQSSNFPHTTILLPEVIYIGLLNHFGIDTTDRDSVIESGHGICDQVTIWRSLDKLTPAEAWSRYIEAAPQLQGDFKQAWRVILAAEGSFCTEHLKYVLDMGKEVGMGVP